MANPENPATGGSGSTESGTFEFPSWKDYYLIIRERIVISLCVAITATFLMGYYLMRNPPVYQSEAALMLDQGARILDMQEVIETGLDSRGQMWRISLENHASQLMSRSFRGYVVESFTEEERESLVAPYLSVNDSQPVPSIGGLVRAVTVENPPNTLILEIQARHLDPAMAALIANRYVERYLDFNRERSQAGNYAARKFLTQQAKELRDRVDQTERELQDYRRRHNLISIEENENLIAQRLAALNSSLTNARVGRINLEGQIKQVEEFKKDGRNLREIGAISSAGPTVQAVKDLDRLRGEREVMSDNYGDRHPLMIANQRSIKAAERLVSENIELAIADLRNKLISAREHEQALLDQLREVETEGVELDRLKVEYTALQRAISSTRRTHDQVLERLDETAITSQLENSGIRIFDYASASGSPVEPNMRRISMLLVFLGGFLFIGTPIGLAAIDTKLKASRDVEDSLGQKLVGEIPSVARIRRKSRPHVVENASDDRAAEAFRGLFSQILLTSRNSFPKALMLTSTIPGEGKSFVANNLAFSFAAHGKKTLLLDFDLRRPSLHGFYGRLNNAGILRWLEDGAPEESKRMSAGLGITEVAPKLFLLGSGGQTKRATETIGREETGKLMKALRERFDVLIVDTPPLGIFPDALPLSQMVDETIYVAHFGKVDRHQVKNCLKRLAQAKSNILGFVMNAMPRGARFAHYYSGYGFGNYKYSKYYSKRN